MLKHISLYHFNSQFCIMQHDFSLDSLIFYVILETFYSRFIIYLLIHTKFSEQKLTVLNRSLSESRLKSSTKPGVTS